jgi:hypothetical protein
MRIDPKANHSSVEFNRVIRENYRLILSHQNAKRYAATGMECVGNARSKYTAEIAGFRLWNEQAHVYLVVEGKYAFMSTTLDENERREAEILVDAGIAHFERISANAWDAGDYRREYGEVDSMQWL